MLCILSLYSSNNIIFFRGESRIFKQAYLANIIAAKFSVGRENVITRQNTHFQTSKAPMKTPKTSRMEHNAITAEVWKLGLLWYDASIVCNKMEKIH